MKREAIFISWPDYSLDGPATGQLLKDAGYDLLLAPKLGARTETELVNLLHDAVGAIVSTDPFTADVLAAKPELRVIARVGVGVDSIDRAAADARGIAITVTPGLNAEAVADHTLALILALTRKVVAQDANVKRGAWERVGPMTPGELPDKVVGLVGAGTIGRAVLRRLRGFGARVLFHDALVPGLEGAEKVGTLGELLKRSDILSLHAPLTAETRHLIRAETIASMRPGALVINTARGPLVDQAALFDALRSGRIGGAGLDVFEGEPPRAATLEGVPNLVCSAHIGGLSNASIARMTASATSSVLAVLAGRTPDTVINPDAVERRGS